MSQEILSKVTNSSSSVIKFNNTHAITQSPIKPTSTQSLSFFDPTCFAQCKVFENLFLQSDALRTLPVLLQARKAVLSIVYKWLKQKQRPHSSIFFILTIDNCNTYTLTQPHIVFNIINQTPEYLKKSLSQLNLPIIKPAYVYHLGF